MPLHFATLEVLDKTPTLGHHLGDGVAKNVEAAARIVVL
jgi:hypothetical protein